MKTITHQQYLQLLALMDSAKQHNAALAKIHLTVLAITGDNDDFEHTTDMVYNSVALDDGLRDLGITVQPPESEGKQ